MTLEMSWLFRNFCLLVGGLVLLPVALFFVIIGLGLGVGFTDNPLLESVKLISLLFVYVGIFAFSLKMSLKKYVTEKTYGSWDIIPIITFCILFILVSFL